VQGREPVEEAEESWLAAGAKRRHETIVERLHIALHACVHTHPFTVIGWQKTTAVHAVEQER
jgi:hypothetical protein